jgi:hypothetical protein
MPALKYWDGAAWQQLAGGGGLVFEQPGDPGAQPVGSIWIDTDEVPPAYVSPPLVTSLPGSPFDGQEVNYLADAANGVVWNLRYRAGSASAYKWEFLGGAALYSQVINGETSASTTFVNLATVGPQITVPLAGDYDIQHGARAYGSQNQISVIMSYSIGATAASANDVVDMYSGSSYDSAIATVAPHGARIQRKTLAAGDAIVAKYRVNAGTGWWGFRWLRISPVRVG